MAKKVVTAVTTDPVLNENPQEMTLSQKAIRARQVAVLFYGGLTFTEIAEELGMAPDTVSKIYNGPDCQQVLAQIQSSDLNFVQSNLREVLPEFCDRLREDISDPESPDKYSAMRLVAKIFGFDQPKKGDKSAVANYGQALQALLGNSMKQLPAGDDEDDDFIEVEAEEIEV